MHPSIDLTVASGAQPTPFDLHFITVALLHALGMGALLMAVTGWVDHKQFKGIPPQANLQNASNVLFMCVAIATVVILVGNNIARAFALGAAIALIRFKMKLGESSSGSGLLFAILCGMASAMGLHSVGWVLAGGYAIVQLVLLQATSRMPQAQFPQNTSASGTPPHLTTAVLTVPTSPPPALAQSENSDAANSSI